MAQRRMLAAFLFIVLAASAALQRSSREAKQPKAAPPPAKTKPHRQAGPAAPYPQEWARGMTLRDKVAQLVMITSFGEPLSPRSAAYRDFTRAVRDLKVGGIIVVNRVVGGSVRNAEPFAMASFLNRMQRMAKVPLLVGADFERGASMRVSGTAKYPHLMAYGAAGDRQLTRKLGELTAREARALGVHWVFAPVSDVNSNPENPIINIRSFGEDPEAVARHVAAFIEGAHDDRRKPVLVTVKHFPGHGDTSVDSHMGLAKLEAGRARMEQTELVPFRSAIKAGVDAVMTAHMAVPAVEPEEIPATLSRSVLTGLLRRELGFPGLIVTDAMDMQGLTKQFPGGEAAVRAVEAGVDMLLMPPDPEAAIKAVVAAVQSGRLSVRRIDESLARVLAAKARVGLHRGRLVNVETISDTLAAAELEQHAQTAADRALTLVKDDKNLVPLRDTGKSCVYVLAESRQTQQGRRLVDELRARSQTMRAVLMNPQMAAGEVDQITQNMAGCETAVVAAFAGVGAFRGGVGLNGEYPAFIESLLRAPAPVVLVSLGSPYLLSMFPGVSAYLAAFSPSPTSEVAVAKALFGEVIPGGRLPVSLPGVARVGDGLVRGESAAR